MKNSIKFHIGNLAFLQVRVSTVRHCVRNAPEGERETMAANGRVEEVQKLVFPSTKAHGNPHTCPFKFRYGPTVMLSNSIIALRIYTQLLQVK
jgi:hypothetical protein